MLIRLHTMKTNLVQSSDGVKIAYDIQGVGPAIVLLHGAGKTRADWHKTAYVARLQDTFTVITIDLRGCGDSEPTLEIDGFRLEQLANDVKAVLDVCGIEQYALWGYSLGGNIARFLATRSACVKALVVIGIPLGSVLFPEFKKTLQRLNKNGVH